MNTLNLRRDKNRIADDPLPALGHPGGRLSPAEKERRVDVERGERDPGHVGTRSEEMKSHGPVRED